MRVSKLRAGGGSGAEAALALHQAGHCVSVVNPAQIHAFGRSGLKRTKTDKADAILIARFCQMHQPPVWTPLSLQLQQLQGLVRRLEHLEEMLTMESNRLTSGGICGPVKDSLDEHISYLEQQIEKTRRHIKDHIDQNPDLKSQAKLLESIPGIGAATAALLLPCCCLAAALLLPCCWRSWVTSLSSAVLDRWRLLPG